MGLLDNLKSFGKKNVPTPPAPAALARKKVLVVEDDQYLRDFYVELLTRESFEVLQAENGQVGLDLVVTQKPDIILLDLMMPVMDGKTMLHRVRQMPECKTLPIIILTNAGEAENITETKVYDNANEFFVKSNVSPERIVQAVRTYI